MRNLLFVLLLVLVVTLVSCLPPPDDFDPEPTCLDGVLNGDETDVDCGGSCPSCGEGLNCNMDSDCIVGNVCYSGVCTIMEPPFVSDFSLFVDVDSLNGQCSDSYTRNENSITKPFCSIQRAADLVEPGDKVRVERGIYRESVDIKHSGTSSDPILFEGVRGTNGEILATIDLSQPTSGWVQATEIDSEGRIYKASLGFDPYEMTSNDKRFGGKLRVGNTDNIWSGWNVYDVLKLPSDYIMDEGYGIGSSFWEAFEALYTYENGVTYVRFRNGEDPSQMNVRASPAISGIKIINQSYITIRSLGIEGVHVGIRIEGLLAQQNIIEHNYLPHGMSRITIGNQASNNHIRYNLLDGRKISNMLPGAWIRCSQTPFGSNPEGLLECRTRANLYQSAKGLFKYGHAFTRTGKNIAPTLGSTQSDSGIHFSSMNYGDPGPGNNNKVYGNTIQNFMGGIDLGGSGSTGYVEVFNNTFLNISSVGLGIYPDTKSYIWDNRFINVNMPLRVQSLSSTSSREVYFFENVVWTEGPGRMVYFHNGLCTNIVNQNNKIWIYHNSANNLAEFIRSACEDNIDAMPVYIVNNIDSSIFGSALRRTIGAYSYNWNKVRNTRHSDITNIDGNKIAMWTTNDQSFVLPSDSLARNSGLDLSKSFVLNGITYESLPGMEPGYFSGSNPNMGAVQD